MYVFTNGKGKKFDTIISIGMAVLALGAKRCNKNFLKFLKSKKCNSMIVTYWSSGKNNFVQR